MPDSGTAAAHLATLKVPAAASRTTIVTPKNQLWVGIGLPVERSRVRPPRERIASAKKARAPTITRAVGVHQLGGLRSSVAQSR
jgi:hypothetical protein